MFFGRLFVAAAFILGVHGLNYYGIPLGELKNDNDEILANVFLANSTFIQLTDANIPKDEEFKFVFGDDEKIVTVEKLYIVNGNGKRVYSSQITGNDQITNYARLFFEIPGSLSDWKKFGLYNAKTEETIAFVKLNKKAPEPFCCLQKTHNKGIIGHHYNVSTGPITILDSRTFSIPSLAFEGTRAPDGWVFAGTGEVNQNTGHKLQVLGRDEEVHCALHEHYDGTTDIVARLPASLTVYDINYLAMFCYQYDVDFGHVDVAMNPEENPVPAFIPPISTGPLPLAKKCD